MSEKLLNLPALRSIVIPFTFIVLLFSASCSKDKEIVSEKDKELVEEKLKEEALAKKIQDIIPAKYLDSLKKIGIEVYSEANPPKIEGTFSVQPLILEKTNVPKDFKIGHKFDDARIYFSRQTENFDIRLLATGLLAERDTSITTAISGSGNNFTVYGKLKAVQRGDFAIFAVIISATLDGNVLRNFKYGLINIDNSKGGINKFILEGQGRVIFESDFAAEKISDTELLARPQNKTDIPVMNRGGIRILP